MDFRSNEADRFAPLVPIAPWPAFGRRVEFLGDHAPPLIHWDHALAWRLELRYGLRKTV
jgi:hypothetical protein